MPSEDTTFESQPTSNSIPSIQPDTEPSVPPSVSYAPTTPLSDEPDNNPNNPSPIDTEAPVHVPVPDSEAEDTLIQDSWVLQDNQLLRIHRIPRTQAS